jgi:NADPH:quinone reductase-like Zn-dependent oxidoreductase
VPTVTIGQPTVVRNESLATLVPAVAASLALWDRLGLSLGETVVITAGHRWSRVAALVATWYGAVPVIMHANDALPLPAGVTRLHIEDPSDPARALATQLRDAPAVVAADLSGRADAVDLLLEALPPMSRLMLAGTAGEPLTIDYYINVHRKGLHLVSGVFEDLVTRRADDDADYRARAERLLARQDRADACRAIIGAQG